jgi:hypothetical protein
MITRLIDKHYRAVSTGLGIIVVSCSSISAVLLLDAPPPDGLRESWILWLRKPLCSNSWPCWEWFSR